VARSSVSPREFLERAAVPGGGVLLAVCVTEAPTGAGSEVGRSGDDGGGDPDAAGADGGVAGPCIGPIRFQFLVDSG